jgi:hypothetical protein
LVISETKAVWSQYGFEAALLLVAPGGVLVVPPGFDKNRYRTEGFSRVRIEVREYDLILDSNDLNDLGESKALTGKGNFLRWTWDEDTRDYVVMWSPGYERVDELWLYLIDDTVYFIDHRLLDGVVQ